MHAGAPRRVWTVGDVVDADPPALVARTYREQVAVRRFLAAMSAAGALDVAADVGCGFGRLTPVLAETARLAIGMEREPGLVARARVLWPGLAFLCVSRLDALPLASGSVDMILSFTVMQHLGDDAARATLREIQRVLRPGGHVLLVEETDPSVRAGDPTRSEHGCTIGRCVEWYVGALASARLVETAAREIEPGYPRADVGTMMWFRMSGEARAR